MARQAKPHTREEIAKHMADFEASGGKVQYIETGVSNSRDMPKEWRNRRRDAEAKYKVGIQ